jgi:hypothetical protein
MGPWWLYLLIFAFGYFTHKTFYFFRSIKISIGLIRVSQLISLSVLANSMENFYYSHTARLRQMREQGEDEKNIQHLKRSFNEEINDYKQKAIKQMLELHPAFYDPIIDFDDWKTGMKFLNENKEFVLNLLKQDKND